MDLPSANQDFQISVMTVLLVASGDRSFPKPLSPPETMKIFNWAKGTLFQIPEPLTVSPVSLTLSPRQELTMTHPCIEEKSGLHTGVTP